MVKTPLITQPKLAQDNNQVNKAIDMLVIVVFLAVYIPLFLQLYQFRWTNIDYTHAYIVLPVSLALAWFKRHEVKACLDMAPSGASTRYGSALIILAGLMFVFGWRMSFGILSTGSLIAMLFGIILYRFNRQVARVLSFPILYLLLLVPPPLGILDAITMPMRQITSTAAAGFLGLFFPVQRDGLTIFVGHVQIYIGAPCSGFRSLITMLALALVYLYVIKMKRKKKLVLLAAVIPLAMVDNFIRVIVLSLITYFLGKEAGEGFLHGFSGMVVFVVMMCGLLGLARVFEGEEHIDD